MANQRHPTWRASGSKLQLVFALCVLVAIACAGQSAHAVSMSYNTLVSANDRSVWGEGSGFSIDEQNKFVGFDWDEGDSVGAIAGEGCSICPKFGVKIGAETNGKVGFNYDLKIDSGTYDIRYPGQASFNVTGGLGDPQTTPVSIASAFEASSTLSLPFQRNDERFVRPPLLQVTGPTAQAGIDLLAEIKAFAGGQVCLVTCYGPAFDIERNGSQELAAINRNNDGQVRLKGDVVAENQPITFLNGLVNIDLNIPVLDSSSAQTPGGFTGFNLVSERRDRIAGVNANLAQIAANAAGFPFPLSGESGGFGYTLLQTNAGVVADIRQRIEFIPQVAGSYVFSSLVTPIINGVQQAATKVVNFNFGDVVTFLAGETSKISFQPFFKFGGTVKNKTSLLFSGGVGVRALGLEIAGQPIGPLFDDSVEGADFLEIPLYDDSFFQGFGTTRLPVTTLDFDCSTFNPNSGQFEICGSQSYDFLTTVGPDFFDSTVFDRSLIEFCEPSFAGQPGPCERGEDPSDPIETNPYYRSAESGNIFLSDRFSAFAFDELDPDQSLTTDDAFATLRPLGFDVTADLPPFVIPAGRSFDSFFPVPEPATLALFGLGVLGLGWRRRAV